jgi:phage terminase large subunit-like protein
VTFTDQRYRPKLFTKPLNSDFVERGDSDGPWARVFAQRYMQMYEGKPFKLDDYQADLIDHALERYPKDWHVERLRGRLRFTEVLVYMGRQNGKSVIATVLGLWGMFRHHAPYVVGLASTREQANIVFNRVKAVIDAEPRLAKYLATTHTRGISRTDRIGRYEVKPAKPDALNGIPVTLCLFDEVHLCDEEMWSQMVLGTSAQTDAMVFGITTAGDNTSTLLKNLLNRAHASAAASDSRFGAFLWYADEGCRLDDAEALLDANPALASGRLDLDEELARVLAMPEDHARRYRFNQFSNPEGSWLPMHMWRNGAGYKVPKDAGRLIFTVDRSQSMEFATITVTAKVGEFYYTQMVASMRKANLEWLIEVCTKLHKTHKAYRFVMDSYRLGDLGKELKRRGVPVEVFSSQKDRANACETSYALIATGQVRHNNDDILSLQMPLAVRKNTDNGWVIRQGGAVGIDAVMATVYGLYAADKYAQLPDYGLGIVA